MPVVGGWSSEVVEGERTVDGCSCKETDISDAIEKCEEELLLELALR